MKYTFFIILFLVSQLTFSQSFGEIENRLAGHLDKMNYYKYQNFNTDSVTIENESFKKLLVKYISEDPATLNMPFDTVVKSGLSIATSADGMFRIYSWDTQTGGTMRFYDNVYQYKTMNKVYYKLNEADPLIEGDPRSWYSEIYTLEDGDKKYYLGVYNADYSTMEKAQGINFFSIEGTSLNDVKLAKTKEGLSSGLGTGYNFFSIPDNDERPFKIVKYDNNKKTITVPLFADNGSPTGKTTVYKFRNGYFEEIK
jgi:hypothetical protein